VLITASSEAARSRASAPCRLVPRAVYNTSEYATTYGEGRMEARTEKKTWGKVRLENLEVGIEDNLFG